MQTRLWRSANERMMAGVCGGLAEYFTIDPVLVRLIFVLVFFTSGLSLPIYLVLWLIMPVRPAAAAEPVARTQVPPVSAYRFDPQTGQPLQGEPPSIGVTVQLREAAPSPVASQTAPAATEAGATRSQNWQWLGIILIGAGAAMFLSMIGMRPTFLFAGLLIGIGVLLLRRR